MPIATFFIQTIAEATTPSSPSVAVHFDPITLVVVLLGFVGTWVTLNNTSKWHTTWITKHDEECRQYKVDAARMMSLMEQNQAKLTAMVDGGNQRINRMEDKLDRVGDK